MGKFTDRTGERFKTKEGYEIVIIEYNNVHDIKIQFQDEHKTIVPTQYNKCKDGGIKNPYHPSVQGVGYIGVGKYKSKANGKTTKEYEEWTSMLKRGFNKEYKNKYHTYEDVTVDEYFYNFQNYCEWREDNYYKIKGEQMELDKDILVKGNKIYSPDTCIFVPQRINYLFIKSNAIRGDYPIGINYHKASGKYVAKCSILNETKYLGCYDTPEEAFLVYKKFKEAYIKEVADEYKNKIPQRLYDAMYAWEIEIDD